MSCLFLSSTCDVQVQSCVPADYMDRQAEIKEKMRAILIDWLIEVWFSAIVLCCIFC